MEGAIYYNDAFIMGNCAKNGIYIMIQDILDFEVFKTTQVKEFLNLFGLVITTQNNAIFINGMEWDGNDTNINLFK